MLSFFWTKQMCIWNSAQWRMSVVTSWSRCFFTNWNTATISCFWPSIMFATLMKWFSAEFISCWNIMNYTLVWEVRSGNICFTELTRLKKKRLLLSRIWNAWLSRRSTIDKWVCYAVYRISGISSTDQPSLRSRTWLPSLMLLRPRKTLGWPIPISYWRSRQARTSSVNSIRLVASGRVIEVGPGSRPAKTRFGSGFLARVFGPG